MKIAATVAWLLQTQATETECIISNIALLVELGVKYLLTTHSTCSCIREKKCIITLYSRKRFHHINNIKDDDLKYYLYCRHTCGNIWHPDVLAACRWYTWFVHKASICKSTNSLINSRVWEKGIALVWWLLRG